MFRFELQAVCPETGARAGILHTAHGDVETPVFMPVGTQGTVKGILARDLLNDLDAKIILGNTYHLFLRPGHETIRKLGGLHRFMNWPRAILTDSGGFQVFSLDTLRKVTEEGVLFRSHLNGDPHFFTPESTIDVQLALGSDIMMVLDECLAYPASHEAARVSTERTLRWARAGYDHYRRSRRRRTRALPDRPGLHVRRSAPPLRRRAAATRCRRLRDRRLIGRRASRSEPGNDRDHHAAAARRDRRATSWAWGCRTSCRSTSRAAST